MRKDIEMDLENGDILLRKIPPTNSVDLVWTTEDSEYIYGECTLNNDSTFEILPNGIGVSINRADSIKKIKIRFIKITDKGETLYTDFLQAVSLGDNDLIGTELVTISDEFYFRIYMNSDSTNFIVTNGYISDLNIVKALDQNEFLLLIADKASIYPSALTGVGIRKYLNQDIRKSNLPSKIQSEFDLDGMTVTSIKYDEETNEILTQSTER